MWNSLQLNCSRNTYYCTYESFQQLPSRHTQRYIDLTAIMLCLSDLCYKTYAVVWLHFISCEKIMWWTQVKRSSTLSPGPEGLFSPSHSSLTLLITQWSPAEGTVLLLLGGWFLLLPSSKSLCWWSGDLAAPYSQSAHYIDVITIIMYYL